MTVSRYNLIVVTGPTASGKTAFAARLAYETGGEIISADSRQVYRQMDLGTGKDYNDYIVNGIRVPVHLTDIAEPGYRYSVFEFRRDFLKAFNDINGRGKLSVLCGGSGMYIQAATRGYRLDEVPENSGLRSALAGKSLEALSEILASMKALHNTTDTDTVEHALRAIEIETYYKNNPAGNADGPEFKTLYLGIMFDREVEKQRITERLESRLNQGMVSEVENLLKSGIPPESLTYYGLEYRFITDYLTGKTGYENMKQQLNIAIHQFAKRQRTWFRKMEKEGCHIHWMNGEWPIQKKIEHSLALFYSKHP